MCGWAGELKKKLDLRSGSQRHRHFVGLFNVPVLNRHGTNLFIRWFRHTATLVAFYDTLGIRSTHNPRVPTGAFCAVTTVRVHVFFHKVMNCIFVKYICTHFFRRKSQQGRRHSMDTVVGKKISLFHQLKYKYILKTWLMQNMQNGKRGCLENFNIIAIHLHWKYIFAMDNAWLSAVFMTLYAYSYAS